MNFKPTLLKTIVSIIVGIVIGFPLSYIKVFGGWQNYSYLDYKLFIISVLVVFTVIYIIWSFVEKKK
jgi:hypothetical protein